MLNELLEPMPTTVGDNTYKHRQRQAVGCDSQRVRTPDRKFGNSCQNSRWVSDLLEPRGFSRSHLGVEGSPIFRTVSVSPVRRGLGNLSGRNRVQDPPERLCRCRKGQLVEDQTLAAGQAG